MNYSGIKVKIKSSWLNPENKETYTIGEKNVTVWWNVQRYKVLIYNKYASYPKYQNLKRFFSTCEYLSWFNKTKIKFKSPMISEIEHFFNCILKNTKPKQMVHMHKNCKDIRKYWKSISN